MPLSSVDAQSSICKLEEISLVGLDVTTGFKTAEVEICEIKVFVDITDRCIN